MAEILPLSFEFPKNIESLSEEEKEEVRRKYQQHVHTAAESTCDTDPSKVIDPDSPEGQALIQAKQKKAEPVRYEVGADENSYHRFDPEKGYIVDGEDINVLRSRDVPPEVIASLIEKAKVRNVSDAEIYRKEVASLGPVERDVEIRFGKI